jgi:hypothetical protein
MWTSLGATILYPWKLLTCIFFNHRKANIL